MKTYTISLEDQISAFYEEMALTCERDIEDILVDSLEMLVEIMSAEKPINLF